MVSDIHGSAPAIRLPNDQRDLADSQFRDFVLGADDDGHLTPPVTKLVNSFTIIAKTHKLSRCFTKMDETFTTKLVIISLMNIAEIVDSEMKRRGLSIREFAKLVGVSHPLISDILSGGKPSYRTCEKLAPVLNMPVETVLRLAGYLPAPPSNTEYQEELLHLFSQLSPEDQKEILELLRFKAERQKSKPKPPSRATKPARTLLKEK